MNIQIDTTSKTIKLAEKVSLKELEEVLIKLFPNNEWKEYSLETNTVINNWTNPYVIEKYVPYRHYYPWYGNTTGDFNLASVNTAGNDCLTTGTYNVAVN